MSTSTRVTRLGITNSQTELRLHVRKRLPGAHPRMFAARFELRIRWFSSSSSTNDSRTASLISSSVLTFSFFSLCGTQDSLAFDPRLEFQKRAPSKRNDRAQKVSFPSSCRRTTTLLQSPPCLQWILPRAGDNVIRFITRESHERCMHLLQHGLQVRNTSLHVRLQSARTRDRLLST